ncbi:hypothetical protein [Morganella morganii]|uniref:hypothetical protein n=1 Tax=Morganella morganii TaxID=582 RepID=UPI001F05F0EA|nr:hypothetical protein [Morganella morganii]
MAMCLPFGPYPIPAFSRKPLKIISSITGAAKIIAATIINWCKGDRVNIRSIHVSSSPKNWVATDNINIAIIGNRRFDNRIVPKGISPVRFW